jgi:putative ABC transport system substrate-binding protein
MKRRDFITFIGGAVAWPVAARTQPAGKVYRVGWLFYIWKVTDAPAQPLFRAFVHGLRDAGYVEGQNLVLKLLSAEGKYERIGELATELVSRNPDVILAGGGNLMARALQRVTKSVPIVIPFSYDPVGAGLVESLSRPGGNLTGFTGYPGPENEAKKLQMLKEAAPEATRIAFLTAQDDWEGPVGQHVQAATRALGVALIFVDNAAGHYADTLAMMTRDRPSALLVTSDPRNYVARQLIVDFAAEQRIPATYPWRESVAAGGLLSYGPDDADLFRRAAGVVDRILKGTKPAEIPIEQPTKLELLINLKTARALGLTIPQSLLLRTDEVIE